MLEEKLLLTLEQVYQGLFDHLFPHFEQELKEEFKSYLLYGEVAPEFFEEEDEDL